MSCMLALALETVSWVSTRRYDSRGKKRLASGNTHDDHGKKIKYLTYVDTAIRNAMMDFISTVFASFEQRIRSD